MGLAELKHGGQSGGKDCSAGNKQEMELERPAGAGTGGGETQTASRESRGTTDHICDSGRTLWAPRAGRGQRSELRGENSEEAGTATRWQVRRARSWAVAPASEKKQNIHTVKDRGNAKCVLVHWKRFKNK